ncbi:MAG: hypothetical protein ACTHOO_04535 [Alcanivorax sp.]
MGLFAQGGVAEGVRDEIEHGFSAEVLSMDDFIRAEQNLERTPATLDEIEIANVLATKFAEEEHDLHTFLYSQKETGREQNNGPGDANTETDLGRRKIGIQDPDAFRKEQERKRTSRRAMDIATEQQIYLARLNAQIEELNRQLEDLYAQKAELEELEESLGFINEDSARGREARRSWNDYLQRTGRGSLDQHKDKDGNVDVDRLDDYSGSDIRETDTQIEETETKRDGLMDAYEQETGVEHGSKGHDTALSHGSSAPEGTRFSGLDNGSTAFGDNNSGFSARLSDETVASSTIESELSVLEGQIGGNGESAFLASADINPNIENAFGSDTHQDMHLASMDSAFDHQEADAFSTGEPVEFDHIAQMESFDAGSAFGSFSGSGEENTNVITDHFAAKVAAVDDQPLITLDNSLENNTQPAVARMIV